MASARAILRREAALAPPVPGEISVSFDQPIGSASDNPDAWIARAISSSLDMTCQTLLEALIGVDVNHQIVPAMTRPQQPILADRLTAIQPMSDRFVGVGIHDIYGAGCYPAIGDGQFDTSVIVAAVDIEIGPAGPDAAFERA